MEEGEIPQAVIDREDAYEMLRFWVTGDGQSDVFLRSGWFPEAVEAKQWGYILADIALHATRAMQLNNPEVGNTESLLSEIEQGYLVRLSDRPDITGSLLGSSH